MGPEEREKLAGKCQLKEGTSDGRRLFEILHFFHFPKTRVILAKISKWYWFLWTPMKAFVEVTLI